MQLCARKDYQIYILSPWQVIIQPDGSGGAYVRLAGKVVGHPDIQADEEVLTSTVVRVVEVAEGLVAHTRTGSAYLLADASMETANERLRLITLVGSRVIESAESQLPDFLSRTHVTAEKDD